MTSTSTSTYTEFDGPIETTTEEIIKLYTHIINGDTNYVQSFIESGYDINRVTYTGVTPLYVACSNGKTDIIRLILDNNCTTINTERLTGVTPLFVACYREQFNVVKLLLENGAEQKANKKGEIPIDIVIKSGRADIVGLLQEYENYTKFILV
jgi:ankyrin repeat protein